MRKFLLVVALLLAASTPALATVHSRDVVTFVSMGPNAFPNCVRFQTTATGGVQGIDNSGTGDSSQPGYTGTAQWNVFGVGTGSGSISAVSGLPVQLIVNSHLTNGAFTINWTDLGANTVYADCNSSSNAATNIGQ